MVRSEIKLIAVLVFLFGCGSTALSQVYPDKDVDNLLKRGINSLINQDYDSAKKIFLLLDKNHSSIPLGKVYLAAAYIAEAYDYAEEYDSEKIESLLYSAIEQSDKLLETNPGDIWNLYFHALSAGYFAYYKALMEDWLPALSDGLNAVSEFEDCVKKDSSFYEAYAAIGGYKYWKSRKTEFLNWLPFINDEKDAGIQLLEKAARYSNYNYYLSIYSLQWIYIDREEYEKAISISQKALEAFPGSRFFKLGMARAYREIDLKKAVKIYYEILNSYPAGRKCNGYNKLFIKYVLAQCYAGLGENEKGIKLCNEILAEKNLTDYAKKRFGSRMEKVRELKKELSASL